MLEARAVTFGYRRDAPVLDRWSARFDTGRVTALAGRSGTGKSTALYLIGLVLKAQAGDVVLDGRSVGSFGEGDRARLRAFTYGFVFQDAVLDPTRTVLDNVLETALYRNDSRHSAQRRALALLSRFGVDLRADHRPGEVSGGQAQRVALCRALLGAPDVILADEPTGNLDRSASETVLHALKEEADRGATVVVATHDSWLLGRCDDVVHL